MSARVKGCKDHLCKFILVPLSSQNIDKTCSTRFFLFCVSTKAPVFITVQSVVLRCIYASTLPASPSKLRMCTIKIGEPDLLFKITEVKLYTFLFGQYFGKYLSYGKETCRYHALNRTLFFGW